MDETFPEKCSEEYIREIKEMESISSEEYFEKYFLLKPPKCDVKDYEGNRCSNWGG